MYSVRMVENRVLLLDTTGGTVRTVNHFYLIPPGTSAVNRVLQL